MSLQIPLYTLPLVVNFALSLTCAIVLWNRRAAPGARLFVLALCAVAVWTLGRIFEAVATEITTKVFWAKVEYIGIANVGILWLLFAIDYTYPARPLQRHHIYWLWAIPIVTLLAAWTNEWHHLLWSDIRRPAQGDPSVLDYDHGLIFWIAVAYNYTVLLIGSWLLLRRSYSVIAGYQRSFYLLVLGVLIMMISNLLYLLGFSPIPGLDLTPFSFVAVALIWAPSILRYHFLDLVPARDTLLFTMQDAVIFLDATDHLLDWNAAAETLLGISRNSARISWQQLASNRFQPNWQLPPLAKTLMVEAEMKDASNLQPATCILHLSTTITPVYDYQRLIGRLIVLHDVSQQKQAEHQLKMLNSTLEERVAQRTMELASTNVRLREEVEQHQQTEAALKQMAARLAEVEESHRQELARELHDQIGQSLTALGLDLSIVQKLLPVDVPRLVNERLNDALALAEATTDQVRNIMTDLRPPQLDDYGLFAALQWYGELVSKRSGLVVIVEGKLITPRPCHLVETVLFRIVQEALNNIVKHAQAKRVDCKLTADERNISLSIHDDGVGFDPTQSTTDHPSTWGIRIMRERAWAIDGQFRIESHVGQGTTVWVEVVR